MTTDQFHYIDIFTDPDWQAKAAVIVGRVTAMDYKTVSAVVNMLEDGVIDPADVERLRDGLAVYATTANRSSTSKNYGTAPRGFSGRQ